MNWLTTLFSGGDAVKTVGTTLEKLFTNDDAREKALEMQKAQQAYDLAEETLISQQNIAQTEVNKIEAASTSLFIAGARPAILWICAIALAYSFVIEPVARFVAKVWFDYLGEFPVIDVAGLYPLLFGMLGISGLRSYDKKQGTDTKSIK